MTREDDDWFTCPNCGEVVPEGALACPACGADDQTGWSEDAAYDDLDLPDHTDEPGGITQTRSRWVLTVGLGLLVVGLLLLMRGC